MNVYDSFQLARKLTFLEEIYTMGERVGQCHWILGGDFNIIMSLEEKMGGIRNRGFCDVRSGFGSLIDLPRMDEAWRVHQKTLLL